MKQEEFKNFVEKTIEEIIQLAEKKGGKQLSRKIAFRWFSQKEKLITENIVQHITDKVYVDENNIFPCVDIGVGDILENNTLVIYANVAGYAPRPWGINWQGKEGPFIYIIGQQFLNKIEKSHHTNQ